MKKLKKSLSVFLAIITIITSCSIAMPVFAEGNLFASENTANEFYEPEEMTSKIVSEVKELREEYAKHFVCEDGSYIVATYSDPVHYKENGQWKEINNSLELSDDVKSSSGKAMYTPKSGNFDVKIPQSFSNGQMVSATNKGYTISFGANRSALLRNDTKATVVNEIDDLSSNVQTDQVSFTQKQAASSADSTTKQSEIATYNSEAMTVKNQVGGVVYENVFDNSDLEYIVTTNSIKENIVVNEKQDKYIYSFNMDFGELTPVINEDNSISLVESKTNETVFYIAAPYMYDANNMESSDIDLTLAEKDGKYILTLQANADWIDAPERAFPVVIDPTVYLSYDDVFVMNGVTYKNTTRITKELRVGRNLTNLTRTYIMPTLPTNIPAGSYINSAYLKLTKDYYYQAPLANDISILAFDCYDVASWKPTNVTWENQPYSNANNGYDNGHPYISSVAATSSKTTYSFNITSAARRWLSGGVNNGLMLASSDESAKTQIDFHSSRATKSTAYPEVYITYTAPALSISSWETGSQASETSFKISTAENWTASANVDWISLGATSGTTSNGSSTNKIIVKENTSTKNRTGTVTVKFGNTIIGTINVTQYGADAYITLDTTKLNFEAGNNKQTINIKSNTVWSFGELPDWVTVTPSTGSKDSAATIEVSENHGSAARECVITVTADTATQNVNITQAYDNIPPIAPIIYAENGIVYITSNYLNDSEETVSPEHFEYKIGNKGKWKIYETPLPIFNTYDVPIYARACDEAGNISEESSFTINDTFGQYTYSYIDMTLGEGVLPVEFSRSYASKEGWFFAFNANVQKCDIGYVFTDFYGGQHYYIENEEGKYVSSDGEELEFNIDNYAYKLPYGEISCCFNAEGKLAFVKNNYISATYTWDANNLYIKDRADNITIVKFQDGKPLNITITRFDEETGTNKIKNVSYQWNDNNLIKFIDASGVEHNYTYDKRGNMTNNDGIEILYGSEQDRVKRILQPNGAFVKYEYDDVAESKDYESTPDNVGAVYAYDSKGVKDVLYYSDGFTVSDTLDDYSDRAVYDPSDIKLSMVGDVTDEFAYVIQDPEDKVSVDAPANSNNFSINQTPLYDAYNDGSYTFYAYDNQYRVTSALDVNANTITITENTTFSDAKNVAQSMSILSYLDNTDNITEWISLEKNSDNEFVYSEKEVYTYFENGQLSTLKAYKWDANKNIWYATNEKCYDEKGNLNLNDDYKYGDDITVTRTTYTYTADNILLERLEKIKIGSGIFVNSIVERYTYNTHGDICTHNISQWLNQKWYLTYNEEYEYNAYGNKTKKTETTYTNQVNDVNNSVSTTKMHTVIDYVYDVWNQPIKNTVSTDDKTEVVSCTQYDAIGRITSVTKEGETTQYTYDDFGNVLTETNSDGTTTYTYDSGNLIKCIKPNQSEATYTYDNFGNLIKHSYNGYTFSYNTLGSVLNVKVNEKTIADYMYSSDVKQKTLNTNFGNGQSVNYVYDSDGRIITAKYGTETKYGYEYFEEKDENGTVTKEWTELTDYVNNLQKIIDSNKLIVNDFDDRFIYSVENVTKDEKDADSFDGKIEKTGSFVYRTEYYADRDQYKSAFSDFSRLFKYNDNGKISEVSFDGLSKNVLKTQYKYNDKTDLTSITHTSKDSTMSYSYAYDNKGNITDETLSVIQKNENSNDIESTETTKYTYDKNNQLLSAENSSLKWEYSYDNRGNMTSKRLYSVRIDKNGNKVYTLTENGEDVYTYDSEWGDKLISYDGKSVAYDESGNPTNYFGHELTWIMDRQLASFDNNAYTYNENGIRTSKTVDGIVTKYYLDGTRLIEQTDGINTLHFNYDRNGEVIGFTHYYLSTGVDDPVMAEYFYVKNAQGDIVGITNSLGEMVVQYTYDSWGKLLDVETHFSTHERDISELNPFRYRGYIYDTETGLYYLQSRYYDPEICRFLNCDDARFIGLSASELSYNPFIYCKNNSINQHDATGYSANSNTAVDILILAACIYGFLWKLLGHENFEIKGDVTKDVTGLYSMRVDYKPYAYKKTKKNFKLVLGDRLAWEETSKLYNSSSRVVIDYYTQCVSDAIKKIGTSSSNPKGDIWYLQIMCVVLLSSLVAYSNVAKDSKKIYNAVWGSNGLDPRHSLEYYAFKITKDKTYNGAYAFSLRLGWEYKLAI